MRGIRRKINVASKVILSVLGGITLATIIYATFNDLRDLVGKVILTVIIGPTFAFLWHKMNVWVETKRPVAQLLGSASRNDQECYIFLGSYITARQEKDNDRRRPPFQKQVDDEGARQPMYGPRWNVGEGDAIALSHIHALLGLAGKAENIKIKRDVHGVQDWDMNIFCIGAANIKIDHVLKLMRPYYRFITYGSLIF